MSEVLALPPAELAGWAGHFRRHPWGDYRTQHLLAVLWSLVATGLSDGSRRYTPDMVAPWLYPDAEEQRQKVQDDARRAMVLREIQSMMDARDGA